MSKCVPILDQMPPEIMEKIVGYTDIIDKFRLRQCCKYFKQIVDDSEIVFDALEFWWGYSKNRAYALVAITDRHRIEKTFNDENPGKAVESAMAALKFMEEVLRSHPKIRVGHLRLTARFMTHKLEEHSEHRAMMEEVSRVFSGLEYKLPVKTLIMELMPDEQLLMSVLPHLVPGTLRELKLRSIFRSITSLDLPRTVETEQWKQAKVLDVDDLSIDLEKTDHFKYMEYRVARLEVEDIKRIVENILRENGWKRRYIYSYQYDFDAIKQYLLQFDHIIEETRDDNDLQMTIRRDGYECKIRVLRRCACIEFEIVVDVVVKNSN